MATFSQAFRSVSNRVHNDHEAIINELTELDTALDDLAGCSARFAYRAAMERVSRCGQRLSQMLPEHFVREETSLLDTVAKVSPELSDFAREMRGQHHTLRGRLGEFCIAVQKLENDTNRTQAVSDVNECGKTFASELRAHVLLEESELDGFL